MITIAVCSCVCFPSNFKRSVFYEKFNKKSFNKLGWFSFKIKMIFNKNNLKNKSIEIPLQTNFRLFSSKSIWRCLSILNIFSWNFTKCRSCQDLLFTFVAKFRSYPFSPSSFDFFENSFVFKSRYFSQFVWLRLRVFNASTSSDNLFCSKISSR